MSRSHVWVSTAAAIATLSACTVGPDYERPTFETAPSWDQTRDVVAADPVLDLWWNAFGDPVLAKLVSEAALSNLDVAEAEARVREARALRGVARGGFWPRVGGDASVTETELSRNGQQLSFAPPGAQDRLTSYSVGFDAAWEIDLFGGTRREVEAATYRLQATEDRLRAARLSAMAETAREVIELRGLQKERNITARNGESQKRTRSLVARQVGVGLASQLDLARAEAAYERTIAQLPRLDAQARSAIYRIGVLTGQDPQALVESLIEPNDIPDAPEIVPIGLRSDILRRRPDVRAAERDLAASTADIGAAVGELFPKFSLTGGVGFENLDADDLFEGDSGTWAFVPLVNWRIFEGGAIRARIRAEEAQAQAAAIAYERTVLTSLEEAESSLALYAEELKSRRRFAKAVTQQRAAVDMTVERYEVGEIDFLAVLEAERNLLELEQELVRSERAVGTQLVALFKALGGGWEPFEPDRNGQG